MRLGELRWENFEKLCYRLVLLDGDLEDVRRYGVVGQADKGIDVLARQVDGRYTTYQCKRYETLAPADVNAAVSRFLDDQWADLTDRFVFCTSHSTISTGLADEIKAQAARLLGATRPVSFVVWDREVLSAKLKDLPDLVRDFFGPAVLEQFFPGIIGPSDERLESALEHILDRRAVGAPVRIVSLDWASRNVREDLEALKDVNREAFDRLTDLGMPPHVESVEATLRHPPPWLQEGDGELWGLVARLAQSVGAWDVAVSAWQGAASRQAGEAHVRSLISGAAAAGIAEQVDRQHALLEEARALSPEHARILLADISEELPATKQLEELDLLKPEHADDRALVAGRMCLAYMMLPDLDRAREQLQIVEEASPGSFMTRALRVNLTIQAGRVNVLEGKALDTAALRSASEDALQLRDGLLEERRWGESGRMLMLAADAVSLLREWPEASELLGRACEEEFATGAGPIVLAESAMGRAMDPHLAMRFIANADPADPNVRRVRAEALERIGTPEERREALETFEALVREGGRPAAEAAFYRLSCAIGSRPAEWDDISYEYLMNHGYEKVAITVRVYYLAQRHADYEQADRLLEPHLDQLWAKAARVRLALARGNTRILRNAAADLLSMAPTQAYRYDAGLAYVCVNDNQRAKEVLSLVARDPAAPPRTRADAYNQLMKVVGGRLGEWKQAQALHAEWAALRPADPRLSRFAPTIANRLRAMTEPA